MGRACACVILVLAPLLAGVASAGRDPASAANQTRRQGSVTRRMGRNVSSDPLAGRTDFAFDLYQRLRQGPGNLFLSPYSVSVALAMAYAGARGGTAREMAEALRFPVDHTQLDAAFGALRSDLQARGGNPGQSAADAFVLHTADSLWGQKGYPFRPEFLDLIAQSYGAGLRTVDFVAQPEAARSDINGWVRRETGSRIAELLPRGSVHRFIRLFLVDAVYFKARWRNRFSTRATRPRSFWLLNGTEVQVEMMHQMSTFRYAVGDGYMSIELPYTEDMVAMVIFVPDLGRYGEFERALTARRAKSLLAELDSQPMDRRVMLAMPKFRYDAILQLKSVLAEMGMPTAFTPQADFSGMTPEGELWIDDVYHSAFVSVDEEGTEAAAGTAVGLGGGAGPSRLSIDRPFIFLIRDAETKTILFLGRVLDPRG